ncbi:MAG: epsH [Chthonomonadaceae bacterium]|nr:epsH [Chthonomonadaceae bacterium]
MTEEFTPAERPTIPLPFLLPFAAGIGLIILLYMPAFKWWYEEWTVPGSFYAHAIFVPFFVAVMIWRDRKKLAETPAEPSWTGLLLVVPAMLMLLVGKRLDVTVLQSFSFMMMVFAVSLLVFGKAKTRLLLFPLCFIIMMMPLIPDQLISTIAFPIQMLSAKLATLFLNTMTLHSVQQGTMIKMDNYVMSVELPCSGFKTLVSLLTFTAAFAYLVDGALWKRWTLFFVTIPLSLFINALRITLIGVVGELVSMKAAGIFHDYSGFIVLTLAFLFLFNFARVLRCDRFLGIPLNDEQQAKDDAEDPDAPQEAPWWRQVLAWRPTGVQLRQVAPYVISIDVLLILAQAVTPILAHGLNPQPPIATFQVPFDMQEGDVSWSSAPSPSRDKLTKEVNEVLSPMRVINRDYGGSDGSHINLFITAGNGRKTFHDPHSCSLGSDAVLEDIGPLTIPMLPGSASGLPQVTLSEHQFHRNNESDRFEFMMFYVVEGKVVQTPAEARSAIMRQMFYGDAGKPSYFVRITQESPGTDEEHRQQLIRFTAAMWKHAGPVLSGLEKAAPDKPVEIIEDPKQP